MTVAPIPQKEWCRRFAAKICDIAGLTPENEAYGLQVATSYYETRVSDGFEDSPEEAAEVDISYWED